jgi:hypothetical protein
MSATASFREFCAARRFPDAESCFRRALRFNRFAHDNAVGGRSTCYEMKTKAVEQAIRLSPSSLCVDDFRLAGDVLVGISLPGVGRVHLRLGDLTAETKEWVWRRLRGDARRTQSAA